MWHHAFVLARIRLTRTAAERGPVLSGACGQGVLAEINRLRLIGARQRTHAPGRVSARGRGVWTLAEASVECSVMSGATAASADETSYAEKRECAGGGDDLQVRDNKATEPSGADLHHVYA